MSNPVLIRYDIIEMHLQWLRDQREDELKKATEQAEFAKAWIGQGQPDIVASALRASSTHAARADAFREAHHNFLIIQQTFVPPKGD